MKCPKCGYLGFETSDRCRNCQYDFSLAPFPADAELTLQSGDRIPIPSADFELPGIARPPDSLSASALDLDRLFGADSPGATPASARTNTPIDLDSAMADPPAMVLADTTAPAPPIDTAEVEIPLDAVDEPAADPSALPFDDAPLAATPRAARPPLAVRRTTPEIPRNRPRTTRPIKAESSLAFDADAPAAAKPGSPRASATETVAALMAPPPLGVRIAAGAIDLALLGAIDAIVVVLTLRMAGLETTADDLRVLPPVPFLAFLGLLAFGYVASFTVAGGQTIGKMLMKLRVIGDDGRPVDAAGGVLRAAGCMLVPVTLGLSYVPALFSSDHRALHDRLAGTRVVRE